MYFLNSSGTETLSGFLARRCCSCPAVVRIFVTRSIASRCRTGSPEKKRPVQEASSAAEKSLPWPAMPKTAGSNSLPNSQQMSLAWRACMSAYPYVSGFSLTTYSSPLSLISFRICGEAWSLSRMTPFTATLQELTKDVISSRSLREGSAPLQTKYETGLPSLESAAQT